MKFCTCNMLLELPTIIGFAETNLLLLPFKAELKAFSLNKFYLIHLTNNESFIILHSFERGLTIS